MIVLHGSAGSPYVARVRMQGYAKDLPIELRPTAPGTPEFRRMNPLAKIPVLEHDGFVLPESQVICEYLEDAFPNPPLLGRTSRDRARARLVARTVDLYCGGLFQLLRAGADPSHRIDAAAERAGLDKGLDALEAFLDDGGYAVAGELSLADCALAPWLYYGAKLTERGDDALTRRRKLSGYVDFVSGQSLVQRVWREMDESFRAFMARWKAEQDAKAG